MAQHNSTFAIQDLDAMDQAETVESVTPILPERFQSTTEAGDHSIVTPELSSVTSAFASIVSPPTL